MTFTALFSMTAGTLFLVWIGELITENGIGNGISVIIFGGIVAGMPGLREPALQLVDRHLLAIAILAVLDGRC